MKRVSDIKISGPFDVYDVRFGQWLYYWYDVATPCDIPPEILRLPVIRTYKSLSSYGDLLTIEVWIPICSPLFAEVEECSRYS